MSASGTVCGVCGSYGRCGCPTPAEGARTEVEFWEGLQGSVAAEKALESKTNAEVADLLMEHVWAHEDMFSAKSALIQAAIDRLKGDT